MNAKAGFRLLMKKMGTKAAIARVLGITHVAVIGWRGVIPPNRAIQLEKKLKGELTRYDLRPDHFGRTPPPAVRRPIDSPTAE